MSERGGVERTLRTDTEMQREREIERQTQPEDPTDIAIHPETD